MFSRFRVVAAFALVVVAGAGCGSSSGGGSVGPGALGGSSSSASTAQTPTPSPPASTPASADGLPSEALLRSALLTAKDAGSNFTAADIIDTGSAPTGCSKLDGLLGKPEGPSPGSRQVAVGLDAGDNADETVVIERLTAETAQHFAADYANLRSALTSCRSLTFPIGPMKLTLSVSPITFAPSSTAIRLDAEENGVPVNGYVVLSSPHEDVFLFFFFLQAGSGSSQFASALYEQAQAKASATLK